MYFSVFKTTLSDNYEDSLFLDSVFWWLMHLLSLELDILWERILETALVWFKGSKLYFSIFIKIRFILKWTFQNGWQEEWFTYSCSKVHLVYILTNSNLFWPYCPCGRRFLRCICTLFLPTFLAHSRKVGAKYFLSSPPTQTVIWFYI